MAQRRIMATQQLLRRRMLRQGLNPERITVASFTVGHTKHLQQYQHVDIAFDPIPTVAAPPPVRRFGWVHPLSQKQAIHMSVV